MVELKDYRKSKKLNQSQMAEILGIDQSFYSKIERGKSELTREMIGVLHSHFNEKVEFISGTTKKMSNEEIIVKTLLSHGNEIDALRDELRNLKKILEKSGLL